MIHRTSDEYKTHLTLKIDFMSWKDSNQKYQMSSKSNNREIMIGVVTDEIIEELFNSILRRYQ